jgi:hypothetical protein
MMNKEKMLYILKHINTYIDGLINEILADSEVDPHYSAVTATNLIKCYIDLMTQLGETLPYHDVESYFKFNAFEKKEYTAFEKRRKKESEYYVGKQF